MPQEVPFVAALRSVPIWPPEGPVLVSHKTHLQDTIKPFQMKSSTSFKFDLILKHFEDQVLPETQ